MIVIVDAGYPTVGPVTVRDRHIEVQNHNVEGRLSVFNILFYLLEGFEPILSCFDFEPACLEHHLQHLNLHDFVVRDQAPVLRRALCHFLLFQDVRPGVHLLKVVDHGFRGLLVPSILQRVRRNFN